MNQNDKFKSFKNKITNLEKRRISRKQEEWKTRRANFQEDIKEVDTIVKELFSKGDVTDESTKMTTVVKTKQTQEENDAFFEE